MGTPETTGSWEDDRRAEKGSRFGATHKAERQAGASSGRGEGLARMGRERVYGDYAPLSVARGDGFFMPCGYCHGKTVTWEFSVDFWNH